MEWFKIYTGWKDAVELMTDEEAGQMLKAVYAYVLRGEKRAVRDRLDIFMAAVYDTISRDTEKFERAAAEEERKQEERKAHARLAAEARWRREHAEQTGACGEHEGACGEHVEQEGACGEQNGHERACQNKNKIQNKEPEKEKDKEKEKDSAEEEERDTDGTEEREYDYCSEPSLTASELPVEEIPLNDGRMYPLFRKDVEEYTRLYPAVDISQELRNIRGWCLANPRRRKTKNGVNRFINGWLSKAQDRGGRPREAPENPFLVYARGEKEGRVIRA